MSGIDRREHWDERYRTVGAEAVSWFQEEPTVSLELLDDLGIGPDASLIDVGGGASVLVDRLVARGATDVTVLDVSAEALDIAAARVPSDAVTWLCADVLTRRPDRRYDVWHDRAVFHFLVDDEDRDRYLTALRAATADGSHVIIGTFAADGPEQCSGLPVRRYDPVGLVEALGAGFEPVRQRREDHVTPSGAVQHFTWVAFRVVTPDA